MYKEGKKKPGARRLNGTGGRRGHVGGKSDGELEAGSYRPSKDSKLIRNVMGMWATHGVGNRF